MRTKIISIVLLLVTMSGCAISKRVDPISLKNPISKIYVEQNDRAHMAGINPEIVSQFRDLGFDAELYTVQPPEDAIHRFVFTANWKWDLAMYLVYFRGTFFEHDKVAGEVEYDALAGGANLNKFGKTAEKIRPLLNELMLNERK